VDAPPADPPPPPAPPPPLCVKAASVPISVRTITNLLVFKALISTPVFKVSVSQCGRLNLVPMAEGIAPLTKSSSGPRGAESAHCQKGPRKRGLFVVGISLPGINVQRLDALRRLRVLTSFSFRELA
jgi:hypothetical protein